MDYKLPPDLELIYDRSLDVSTTLPDNRTYRELVVEVMQIQNASNLVALVGSFHNSIMRLYQVEPGKATSWYAQHPITVLWLQKLHDLAMVTLYSETAYSELKRYLKDNPEPPKPPTPKPKQRKGPRLNLPRKYVDN